MDSTTLDYWRMTIKRVLSELAAIPYAGKVTLKSKTVFDDAADIYMVIVDGWEDVTQRHGVIVHVEIRDGKIWIQRDGTEYGIANELVAAGISKDKIVLGFKTPQSRKFTDFAVA